MTITACDNDILSSPVKFLGATVLSLNGSLGWGTQESSINVDLIEDCESGDNFIGDTLVGQPVVFPSPPTPTNFSFRFAGILTNWTVQKSQSGRTYNVKVSDPRQLLENSIVIVDQYAGPPVLGRNYINVYAYYEQSVFTNSNCGAFGSANMNDRGMEYTKVLSALQSIGPNICSPTGSNFYIDLSSLVAPAFARVTGPGVTLLQIVQEICDMNGQDFYVTLEVTGTTNTIKINPVKLIGGLTTGIKDNDGLIYSIDGTAIGVTDISYGQELVYDKTKAIVFGEKQHYMVETNEFLHFFGEDLETQDPIVPVSDQCGFTVRVDIRPLNGSLLNPLAGNYATITEYDIRAALAGYPAWLARAFDPNAEVSPDGSLNKKLQSLYPDLKNSLNTALNSIDMNHPNAGRTAPDRVAGLNKFVVFAGENARVEELKAAHEFVSSIGNTYYGKQFLTPLPDNICIIDDPDNFRAKKYSAVPTNDGGWSESSVLGLDQPALSYFATEDGRISPFALFSHEGPDPAASGELKPEDPPEDFPVEDEYVPGGGT